MNSFALMQYARLQVLLVKDAVLPVTVLLDIPAKILSANSNLHLLVSPVNRMMSVLVNLNVTKVLVSHLAETSENFVLMIISATPI